jgi:Gpi18-like mannosyltransferase
MAIILMGIVGAYAVVWPYVPYDMGRWLVPWFDTFLQQGRIRAFDEPIGNYTPPFLYLLSFTTLFVGLASKVSLIKVLSLVSIATVAIAVRHLLTTLGAQRATEAALWLCLLPSVLANGPLLGQCDGFWAAAAVMAVVEAVKGRHVVMLVWCGVAVAFKAQAIFLAPMIIGVLISKRVPLSFWAIPIGVYAAAMVPAWLVGWPAYDLATVYLRQAQWVGFRGDFVGNAANPWSFVPAPVAMEHFWLGYVAAAAAAIALIITMTRRLLSTRQLVEAALLSSMVVPFLLPKMHERFFFLADVLSFSIAWACRDRFSVGIAILVQGSSFLALYSYLSKNPAPVLFGAALMGAAILALFVRLLNVPVITTSNVAARDSVTA